jgi:hypothetical protein
VDRGDLAAAVGDRVIEGVACDPLGGGPGDDLDALGGVGADHVLDAGVEIFRVLADDDEVDVFVARVEPLHRPGRTDVGVEPEGLTKGDVDAPEALAHRRGDRALEGDLVLPDRLEDVLRQRRPVLADDRFARVDGLPFESDARGIEDAAGCLRQLRSDAVARNEGDAVGHAVILARARPGRRSHTGSSIAPTRGRLNEPR